jgi:hypothetical protein
MNWVKKELQKSDAEMQSGSEQTAPERETDSPLEARARKRILEPLLFPDRWDALEQTGT